MFIIEESKAYLVNGNEAKEVSFGLDGKMNVNDKNTIEVKGQPQFTYDEMYCKLNIAFQIQQAKKDIAKKQLVEGEAKEIINENGKLKEEITSLKEKLNKPQAKEETKNNKKN